jgi:predicted dehydrogenase
MAAPLDPRKPVRWGILGAGAVAATVGTAIAAASDSEVVAVGARDAGRAAEFAHTHGIARSYGSYAELVADPDLDVIYVATTHGQHHEHALLALRAGKAVLVEKAFTLNAWQAREVVAEARNRRLFCMEAMWMRLNPMIHRVVEIARSGRIGDVTSVRADLSRRFPYDPRHRLFDLAAGGGALLDLGVYPLTFVWSLLGKPASVSAIGTLSPTGSDLVAALQLSYPEGQVAQIHTSAAGVSPDAGLVVGTGGWIRLEPRIHRPRTLTVWTPDGEETIEGSEEGNGYGLEVAEVVRCLRAGLTESPSIPLDDTVGILEIIDLARAQLGVVYAADAEGPDPAAPTRVMHHPRGH